MGWCGRCGKALVDLYDPDEDSATQMWNFCTFSAARVWLLEAREEESADDVKPADPSPAT